MYESMTTKSIHLHIHTLQANYLAIFSSSYMASVDFCTHYQIHLHHPSHLVKFITYTIAFITQFDKAIIVDSLETHFYFQNANDFVKSVFCTICLHIMLSLCLMLFSPYYVQIMLA